MKLITLSLFIFSTLRFANRLDLEKYIKLSIKNNPAFAEVDVDKEALDYIVDQGLPSREFTLSLRSENGYNADSDDNTTSTSAALSKSVIESGTDFTISHSRVTRPDTRENVTEIRLEQSLYKNAFGQNVRLKKSSLLTQKDFKELESEEAREKLFSQILKTYLELSKAYRDFKLAKALENEAIKLEKNVASKAKQRVATSTDLKRAKLLVLLRKEEVLEKETTYKTLKNQIEENLSYDFTSFVESDSEKLIKQLTTLYRAQEQPSWASTRSFKIAQLRDKFNANEATLLAREDSPDVSFIIGYNKDDSSRFSTSIERSETVVGLKLEVPIGDTQARANYQAAKLNHLKSNIQSRKDALEFSRQKTVLLNNLKQAQGQLSVNQSKVKLTADIVMEEERRFSIGRLDLDTLIELKSDYASYRAALEQSKLIYGMILIDWLELADNLSVEGLL